MTKSPEYERAKGRHRLGAWNLVALEAREQRIRDIRKGLEPDPARHTSNLKSAFAMWYNGETSDLLTASIEEANKLSYYHELNGQEPDITATESKTAEDEDERLSLIERLERAAEDLVDNPITALKRMPNETAAQWVVFHSARDTSTMLLAAVNEYEIVETEADAKAVSYTHLTLPTKA